MQSKKRRLFNECFNIGMSALVLLPALVIIQKIFLPEAAPWAGVLWMLPIALCFPAGRLLRKKERQAALSLCVVIAAACAVPVTAAFGGSISLLSSLFVFLLSVFCGVMLFFIPYIAGSNIASGKYFVAGLALYVIALALGGEDAASYALAMNICSVVLLICGLFVFNLEGLRSATAPSGGKAKFPKGMRRNNLIIIGVFVVLALLLANIKAIKDAAVAAGIWFVNRVVDFLNFMGNVNGVPEGDGAMGGTGNDMSIGLTADPHVSTPLEDFLWNAVLFIIIAGILVALCFLLYKVIRKLMGRFGGLIDRLLGRIAPQTEDYVDETEDLDGEREKREGLLTRIRTRFARKAKFGDMETDRAKVRFAMREFLQKDKSAVRTRTASELAAELESAAGGADFADVYNRARYSTQEPSSEDVETARRLVDRL